MPPRIREKPHRLPRTAYRGRLAIAFTICIQGRRRPFAETAVVEAFITHLADAADQNRCLVPVYCFMPDHLHLILQGVDDTADAWQAVVRFKQHSGFWFGRNRPEFAWQKDFYDHVIRADEDLAAQVRYVAENPVREGLCQVWNAYPFTGAIGADLPDVLSDCSESHR